MSHYPTIAIAFCHNAVLASGRLAVPLVAIDLGAQEGLVGLLAGLFTIVPIFATMRFGRWIETVGTRFPTVVAAMILIISALAVVVQPGLPILAVAATLIGAGAVFSHVALTRAVAGVAEADQRARNLSHLAVGYSLCQFVAPTLTGIAYDHYGPRGAFGFLTGLGLLSLILIFSGRTMLGGPSTVPPDEETGKGMAGLLASPGMPLWLFLYGTFAAGLVFYAMAAPLHGKATGLSASQIGSLYGMLSLGALSSRLAAPGLSQRLSAPRLLALALTLAGLVCAVVPLLSVWLALAVFSYLLGGCLGIGQPVTIMLIYNAAATGRINETIGLSMAVTNTLQLATPLGLGVVATLWGVGPMIWLFAAVLALAGLLALLRGRAYQTG